MKRLLALLLIAAIPPYGYAQTVPISGLPAGTVVDGSTQIPAVNSGTTVKVTPSLPWTFAYPSASGVSTLTLSSSNPILEWNRTTSTADNKRWRAFAGATNWQFGPCADDGTTCTVALQYLRNTSTVTDIDFTATNGMRINGNTVSTATAANPSQTIGLAVVNGSANTFMRSDAAPALSQNIVPTWSGAHTFSANQALTTSPIMVKSAAPALEVTNTGAAANNQRWRLNTPSTTTLALGPLSDDGNTFTQAFVLTRSGTTASQIDLNATNVRINGTTVQINSNPVSTSQSGTFTAAWVNGCSDDPVQSFRYTLNGNVVVIQMFGATSCTSDANNKSTASGALPLAIRPANQQQAKYTNVNYGGTPTDSCLTLQPDGQIQLHVTTACGANPPNANMTISAAEQSSLTYLIN